MVGVSSRITKDGMSKGKVDPAVSSLREKSNSVLYVQCGKWIDSRCARVKMVSPKFSRKLNAVNVTEYWRQWSRKKSYVMKWKL